MDTLTLDEENELYGYGIYNTDHNTFMPLNQYDVRSKGYFENDELVNSEQKAVEVLQAIANDEEIEKKAT